MPRLVVGIDLGTSGVRAVAVDPNGNVVATATRSYSINSPSPGYAEQNPADWLRCTAEAVRECASRAGAGEVEALSFSGQMHGTVLVDKAGEVVRPAIIWADQRSQTECREFVDRVGADRIARSTANRIAAGFQLASLLWLRAHEPESLARAFKVLLPKDFLRGKMTGVWATEPSDACGTLAFDTARGVWADELISAAGVAPALFPECRSSIDCGGFLTEEAAGELGLIAGLPVFMGGGDTPATALGAGVLDSVQCLVTIGSGGQLLVPLDQPRYDPGLRTNTFCHVTPGTWYAMGAILSAGLSLKWFREKVLGQDAPDFVALSTAAEAVPPGSEGLLFLPYLTGERTPHMTADACGVFFGLTPRHTSAHLVRAIMEGVAMALADGLEIVCSLGAEPESVLFAGGGSKSRLWRQILAGVFASPVAAAEERERAALGAAMIAATGAGWYASLREASEAWRTPVVAVSEPEPNQVACYRQIRPLFRYLYPALEDYMTARAEFVRGSNRNSHPETQGKP